MKKSDLKTGMYVKTRCNLWYIVLLDTESGDLLCNEDNLIPLAHYTEELEHRGNTDYHIVAVGTPLYYISDLINETEENIEIIWERIEPLMMSKKEALIALKEKFGRPVVIID